MAEMQKLMNFGNIKRPPNCPNNDFEENPSNIMSIETYQNALRNNEYMIPHPDFSKELRQFRNKRGNLKHKELIFKTYKETWDSYNGIEEKIQFNSEDISIKLNNSGIHPDASIVIFK